MPPPAMPPLPGAEDATAVRLCNCLMLRQAARHLTQFYDSRLMRFGLRTTQFSILVRLRDGPPWAISSLAEALVMDRTTLGRNLRPLERDGLVRLAPHPQDRRSRVLEITERGQAAVARAEPAWHAAQQGFEQAYGPVRATALRAALREVVATVPPPV